MKESLEFLSKLEKFEIFGVFFASLVSFLRKSFGGFMPLKGLYKP